MFVTNYEPPIKRRAFAEGGVERRLTEPAVMLAFAFHLLECATEEALVTIHPDGEHAKIFEIAPFLAGCGFERIENLGRTMYGGRYVRGKHALIVNPTSGKGDVVGEVDGRRVIAECKGGVDQFDPQWSTLPHSQGHVGVSGATDDPAAKWRSTRGGSSRNVRHHSSDPATRAALRPSWDRDSACGGKWADPVCLTHCLTADAVGLASSRLPADTSSF